MDTVKINRTSSLLTKVQNFFQYLLFGWFLAASVLLAFGGNLARSVAWLGITFILVAIVAILATLAEQYRRARKRNWFLSCYILIAIITASAAVRYLVP